MAPIPTETIRHRFPNIIKVCQHWGIDVFSTPIPVAPAAHYWMGGIVSDLTNSTNIKGLYAVGETASTGVHGANRLASNSLLECIVFGAQMANIKLEEVKTVVVQPKSVPLTLSAAQLQTCQIYLNDLRENIPRLMWQCAGICREQHRLEGAIATVETWQRDFNNLLLSQFLIALRPGECVFDMSNAEKLLPLWAETRNLLDVAYLILKSAAFRTESRGGHYRTDFPQQNTHWQAHTLVQNQNWYKS